MAKETTLKPFESNKSARELRSDWNWTVAAIIIVAILILTAATFALLFGALSPYASAPAVNP